MSDGGNVSPDPAIARLPVWAQQILTFASAFARPFATYMGAIAVFVGVVRINTVDALWVAATMAGVYGVARSFDKRAPANKQGM